MSSSPKSLGIHIPHNKRLGSILNNDIDNILTSLSGAETTPAEYKKAVMHLLDS